MLTAESTGFWGTRYNLAEDGRPVTTWELNMAANGGGFDLDGRRYEVKANMWATEFSMTDETGGVVAEAGKLGHKNWTVRAGGRAYEFRRAAALRGDQHLMEGDEVIGSIRRTSTWTSNLEADLPGIPLPVRVFVLGVMLLQWQAANAS